MWHFVSWFPWDGKMNVLGFEKWRRSALEFSRHRGTFHPYLLGIRDICPKSCCW